MATHRLTLFDVLLLDLLAHSDRSGGSQNYVAGKWRRRRRRWRCRGGWPGRSSLRAAQRPLAPRRGRQYRRRRHCWCTGRDRRGRHCGPGGLIPRTDLKPRTGGAELQATTRATRTPDGGTAAPEADDESAKGVGPKCYSKALRRHGHPVGRRHCVTAMMRRTCALASVALSQAISTNPTRLSCLSIASKRGLRWPNPPARWTFPLRHGAFSKTIDSAFF